LETIQGGGQVSQWSVVQNDGTASAMNECQKWLY
jgi:hypothetical protein